MAMVGKRKPAIRDTNVRHLLNVNREEHLASLRETKSQQVQPQTMQWLLKPPVYCVSETVDPAAWAGITQSSPEVLPAHLMTHGLRPQITGIPEYAQFWRVVGRFGSLMALREACGFLTATIAPWAVTGLVPVAYRDHIDNALESLGVMPDKRIWDYDRIIPLDPVTRRPVPRWAPAGQAAPFSIIRAENIWKAWPDVQERFRVAGLEPPLDPTTFPCDDPVSMRLLAEGYCAWGLKGRDLEKKHRSAIKRRVQAERSEDLSSWANLRTMYDKARAGTMLLEEAQRLRSNYKGKQTFPLMREVGIDIPKLRALHGPNAVALLTEIMLCWLTADMDTITQGLEVELAATMATIEDMEESL